MSDDRTEGSMKKMKGDLKEGAGKLSGDSKLQSEGKADGYGSLADARLGGGDGSDQNEVALLYLLVIDEVLVYLGHVVAIGVCTLGGYAYLCGNLSNG